MKYTICLYFPKNPETLLKFLSSVFEYQVWTARNGQLDVPEVLLWVDNDDHAVSSAFYEVRKLGRQGLNLNVFVEPRLASTEAVYEELKSRSCGDIVLCNTTNEDHFGKLMGGPTIFDESEIKLVTSK